MIKTTIKTMTGARLDDRSLSERPPRDEGT